MNATPRIASHLDATDSRKRSRHFFLRSALATAAALLAMGAPRSLAADGTWTGSTNQNWSNTGNWSGGIVPGAFNNGTNPDTATFNTSSGATTVNVDDRRSLSGITFSTGAGAFTFVGGGNGLQLVALSGGPATVQTTSGVTNAQAINTDIIQIRNTGTYSFLSNASLSSATLSFGGTTLNLASSAGLILGGSNAGANTISNNIIDGNGTATLTKQGSGLWVLTGSGSYGGGTTISSGTLQIGNGGTTGYLSTGTSGSTTAKAVTNNSVLAFNRSNAYDVSNNISGSGSVQQIGSGLLTLTGSNSYSGGTLISSGTLRLGSSNALGTSTGSLAMSGGALDLGGFNGTVGALNGSAGTVITNSGSSAFLTVNATGSSNFGGVIQDGGGSNRVSVSKSGTGTILLSGLNTYTGVTVISNGVLEASVLANGGEASSIGAATNLAANLTINGGTLRYTGTGASTNRHFQVQTTGATLDASGSGALSFVDANAIVTNGSTDITIAFTGTNTGENTFAGNIGNPTGGSAATSVTKDGTGKWVLSGSNSYTGDTVVNAGTLLIKGSVSSSTDVTVAGGATLGIGKAAGADGFSTADFSTLTLSGSSGLSSRLALDLGAGGVSDRINTLGAGITILGDDTINLVLTLNGVSDLSGNYILLDWGGGAGLTVDQVSLAGSSSQILADISDGSYELVVNGNTLQLNAVPEPSAIVLFGMGLGLWFWRFGRRRFMACPSEGQGVHSSKPHAC